MLKTAACCCTQKQAERICSRVIIILFYLFDGFQYGPYFEATTCINMDLILKLPHLSMWILFLNYHSYQYGSYFETETHDESYRSFFEFNTAGEIKVSHRLLISNRSE